MITFNYFKNNNITLEELTNKVNSEYQEFLIQKGNEEISLSRMTLSHQMIRMFFVEQIYRAMTILNGEPYHHE